jgi:glucose/arabinose dehydrogenase
MVRLCTYAACLALVAFLLTACSRDKAQPQAANQAPPAPQVDSDHGDNDDAAPDIEATPTPRISLEPPREINTAPSGFSTPEESPSVEEEPAAPSIFRSLGRALTRGVTDAVKQGRGESASDSSLPPESPDQDAASQETPEPNKPQP